MKKLVTLSAVALAGATLGVGTTFGWWAGDSDDQRDVTNVPSLEPIPATSAPGILFDGLSPSLKKSDGESDPTKSFKTFRETYVPATPTTTVYSSTAAPMHLVQAGRVASKSAVEKLAKELEAEAVQLDANEQPELAKIKRDLAARLRAAIETQITAVSPGTAPGVTLQSVTVPTPVTEGALGKDAQRGEAHIGTPFLGQFLTDPNSKTPAVATPQPSGAIVKAPTAVQPAPAVKPVDRELMRIQGAIQATQDPAVKAELQSRVQEAQILLQANNSPFEVQRSGPLANNGTWSEPVTATPQRTIVIVKEPNETSGAVARELRQVAEMLEQQGHPEQAAAVRQHIDRMHRQITATEARRKAANQRFQEERIRRNEQAARDADAPGLDEKTAPLRDPNVLARRREVPRGADEQRYDRQPEELQPAPRDDEPRDRESSDLTRRRPVPPMPGDVHRLLRELRSEIGQLRNDVRDMRRLLGDGQNFKVERLRRDPPKGDERTERDAEDIQLEDGPDKGPAEKAIDKHAGKRRAEDVKDKKQDGDTKDPEDSVLRDVD